MRQSDLVLDLNKLEKIGTSYAESLEAFHFDVTLLEQAASLSKQLGSKQVRAGMP